MKYFLISFVFISSFLFVLPVFNRTFAQYPPPPPSIAATAIGCAGSDAPQAAVGWDDPGATSFQVYRNDTGGLLYNGPSPSPSTTFTFGAGDNGKTLTFNVVASNAYGSSQTTSNAITLTDCTPTPTSSPTPTPIPTTPIGNHDGVDNTYCLTSGWAFDQTPGQTSTSLWVHVYRDGPVGGGGTFIGAYLADQARPDVNNAFGIGGNHGFNITFTRASGLFGGAHNIYVYAIDSTGDGGNPLLNSSPQLINCTDHYFYGFVFKDANRNGIFDTSDPDPTKRDYGLWSRTVNSNSDVGNVNTDGNGYATFYPTAAGNFGVWFNGEAGLAFTTASSYNIAVPPDGQVYYFGLAVPPDATITPDPPNHGCTGNSPTISFNMSSAGANWYAVFWNQDGNQQYGGASGNFSQTLPYYYSNTPNVQYDIHAYYDPATTWYSSKLTTPITLDDCYDHLSGYVYIDNNRNGTYDGGDSGYPSGSTILLNGGNNYTTNGAGLYTYDTLLDGNYTVSLPSIPSGYVATSPNPTSVSLTLNSNATRTYRQDFGIAPVYNIGCAGGPGNNGTVYADHDRNGTYSAGDTPISGVTVTLTGTLTYGNPAFTPQTTTTDGNGNYCFQNLYAGTYTVTITPPANYQVPTTTGNVTVPPTTTGPSFSMIPLYQISGVIFNDNSKDGFKNGTEANMPNNFTIQISGPSNPAPISTVNGAFTSGIALYEGTYTVSLTTTPLPQDYQMTYPLNGPPPSFQVTIGRSCTTNGVNSASCTSAGFQFAASNVQNLNFGMSNLWIPPPVCLGADCRIECPTCGGGGGGGGFQVPSGWATSCTGGADMSFPGPNSSTPGIIFSGDNQLDFGAGQASANPYNWQVGGNTSAYSELFAAQVKRTSYTYMTTTLRESGITPTPLSSVCTLNNCTLPANLASGIYQGDTNTNVHLNTYTFPNNKSIIILINGDLYVDGEIHVPVGSSVTFSVSGDIHINKAVGVNDVCSQACNIEGWFSTDKSFILDGYNSCVNYATDPSTRDKRVNVCGGISVNAGNTGGSVQNQRDLCDNDQVAPSFSLIFRPDFLLNAPEFLKYKSDVWKEVAP